MSPEDKTHLRRWSRPPLWVVVTLALLVLAVTAMFSIAGPALVENWTVERLKKRSDVAFYWKSGEVSWGTDLISEIRRPKERQIQLKSDFPRDLLPLLRRIRHVKAFWIESDHIRDEDLAIFWQLSGLEGVGISGCGRTTDAFRHLDGLPIVTLTLEDMEIPDGAWEIISKLPQLRGLWIENVSFVESDFSSLRHNTSLEWISFYSGAPPHRLDVSASNLETIGSIRVLKSLTLTNVGASDTELRRLPATMLLKSLELQGAEITDQGVAGLQVDPDVLKLFDTSIAFGPSTEPWLKSRKRCRKINVTGMGIPAERIAYLNTLGPAQLYENAP